MASRETQEYLKAYAKTIMAAIRNAVEQGDEEGLMALEEEMLDLIERACKE